MAGGIPSLKDWIVNLDPHMVQVPFPDGFRHQDTSFDGFLTALDGLRIGADEVAGVITETYQGGNSSFAPPEYVEQLRRWCDEHQALLPQLARRLELLEKRVALVEDEQRGEFDLTKFYEPQPPNRL